MDLVSKPFGEAMMLWKLKMAFPLKDDENTIGY
jgi:hypothetical protein